MGNFAGATKVNGNPVTAAGVNTDRLDVLINAGDYELSTGSSNAYLLSLDSQIVAYEEGMVVKFKANFSNTGPATINVNGLGVRNIYKNVNENIQINDILTDQITQLIYDGTNFQLVSNTKNITTFGGDGLDGALNVTSGTTTIDCGGANILVKNYTSINISAGATVNFSNLNAQGTIVIFKSQGNVTIAGTIDGSGCGASPGQTAFLALSSTSHSATGGGQGTNGTNGGGPAGTDGAAITAGSQLDYIERILLTTSVDKLHRKSFIFSGQYGPTSPSAGLAGTNNSLGDNPGGTAGTAGVSGRNGTLFVLECAGALDFSGLVDVSGKDGTDGGNGGVGGSGAANRPGAGGGGGGGGGAGGNGGFAFLFYNFLIANTGTIDSSGGDGGDGGVGGAGGNGVGSGSGSNAGAGGGSGFAGSASGTTNANGAIGGTGKGGQASTSSNNTYGGTGGSGGAGGAGGGTFFGGAGTNGTQGAQGSLGASVPAGAGGSGGAKGVGGNGAASIGGIVTKNYYF